MSLDPVHLVCLFRIKLIRVNIKNEAVIAQFAPKILKELEKGTSEGKSNMTLVTKI